MSLWGDRAIEWVEHSYNRFEIHLSCTPYVGGLLRIRKRTEKVSNGTDCGAEESDARYSSSHSKILKVDLITTSERNRGHGSEARRIP